MNAILALINIVLDLFWLALLLNVIFSWLISFNVINAHQPFVQSVMHVLSAICEPVLGPIRRFLSNIVPPSVPVDLSPLVALILVRVLQVFIMHDIAPILLGY